MTDASPQAQDTSRRPGKLDLLRRRYRWFDRLVRAAARYQEHYGDYYAAAITYFSVLALVPLLMIGFAIAGLVLAGHPALLGSLRASITTAIPNPQLSDMLNSVVSQAIRSATTVGVIGLLVALYSGLSWMTALREALTALWGQQPATISFVRRTVVDLLSLLGLGAALAISFGISAFRGGLGQTLLDLTGVRNAVLAGIVLQTLALVLSMVANWLVFLWVLARLPRQSVAWRNAIWGAVFAAAGFEVIKQVGVVYLGTVTGTPTGIAFGPVLGLLVFSFLTARFVLFVTAWTALGQNSPKPPPQPPKLPAIIRPNVQIRDRVGPVTAVGLLGIGALVGWILRQPLRRHARADDQEPAAE